MIGLYDHQKRAVRLLRSGSVLCGGVGTGKSLTALAYYFTVVCDGRLGDDVESYRRPTSLRPLYIISTARKRDTLEWHHECAKLGLRTDSEASDGHIPPKDPITIDSWNNIKKYVDVKGAFFIFDEQRVVGKGAWVKAFLKIAKNNDWIMLTATPGDQWVDYIPLFIANGFYKNRTQFIREHVVYAPMSKFPKIVKYLNTRRLMSCLNKILVRMEYERKATVHEDWVETRYDRKTYDRIFKERWNPFDDKPVENVSQYCFLQRRVVNTDPDRAEHVLALQRRHRKAIVFYNFNEELYLLREMAESNGIQFGEWNGHKHDDLPTGKDWLYFVQYGAGAEGWNCTSSNCIIFFSLTYSYKTFVQAKGRIDRINTRYTDLYYYELTSKSPIDRAIRACLVEKRDFNEKAFASQENRIR